MGNEQIKQYILEQSKKGYSVEQIRAFLLSHNYSKQVIDSCINEISIQNSSSKPAATVVKNPLTDYVKQQLNSGFTIDSIRDYLKNYGYPQDQIDDAINQAYSHKFQNHSKGVGKALPVLLGILLLLIISSFFMFSSPGKNALLDYNIESSDKTIQAGSTLRFTDKFTNIGKKKDYDVFVEYFIQEMKTNIVIDKWEETIGIDSIENHNSKREIPEDIEPGKYIIRGIVTYYEKEARAYDTFTVVPKTEEVPQETCTDNIKNQGEDNTDCGGPCQPCIVSNKPTCYDGIKNQNEKGVDCGGSCRECPSCEDEIKNQGEERIDCGGPCSPCTKKESCYDDIQNQDETGVDCGGICAPCFNTVSTETDATSAISNVKEYDNSQINNGIRECKGISVSKDKDECFLSLATGKANESGICQEIESDSKNDICYMHFVNNKDYSVCDKIINNYIKRSCKSLKQINELTNRKEEYNSTINPNTNNVTNSTSRPSGKGTEIDIDKWNEIADNTIIGTDNIGDVFETVTAKKDEKEVLLNGTILSNSTNKTNSTA